MTAEDTLAQWNRQLETVRAGMLAGGGKPGVANPALAAGKTGLQVLQSMLAVLQMPEAGRQIIYGTVIVVMLLIYGRGARESG